MTQAILLGDHGSLVAACWDAVATRDQWFADGFMDTIASFAVRKFLQVQSD